MADINDLFDAFPDYNVFNDSTAQTSPKQNRVNRTGKQPKNVQDFRRNDDYDDGFGVYEEKREIKQNFSTILFFPILILWLEATMRFSLGQSFMTINLLYVFLFSMPIASVLTLLCTFGNSKLNRHFVRILTLVITLWYCMQMIYHQIFDTFMVFFKAHQCIMSFDSFINALTEQRFYLLMAAVPLIFFSFLGKFTFPFKKVNIPAKIVLILLAVLFQLFAATSVLLSKTFTGSDETYQCYHGEFTEQNTQEHFGMLTMERFDVTELIENSINS